VKTVQLENTLLLKEDLPAANALGALSCQHQAAQDVPPALLVNTQMKLVQQAMQLALTAPVAPFHQLVL
jgi:hypothetical protein